MKDDSARWLIIAEPEIQAAELLVVNGLYSQAIFHTHLWMEKLLKAQVTEHLTLEDVPRTHNLRALLQMAVDDPPQWVQAFLGTLSPHSTSSRYALPPGSLVYTEELARRMLEGAREVAGWLSQQLT